MSFRARAVALAGASLFFVLTATPAAEPAPYSLAVEVAFPDGAASPTLAEEVVRRLVETLAARACFASVRSVPADGSRPDTDLLLHLDLWDIQDETRYDDSLAGFNNQDDPDAKLRYTVVLSVQVLGRLLALPGDVEVGHQRFRPEVSHRPMYQGEDVRRAVKDEMMNTLARRTASLACGASQKKMRRAVEAARSAATPAEPPR